MKHPRRFSIVFFTALVVLSTSVFSVGRASAEVATPVNPLRSNEPVIQLQTQIVAQKTSKLNDAAQQIQDLQSKKQSLAQQLDDIKQQVNDLNQQLSDKKAAADAEQARVDALKNMFVHINGYAADSSGNLYAFGNCTWYVKNRRPDIPNNLGNANTWYVTAQAEGWNVGTAPKKGAVGTTTAGWAGHVVYVEGVSLDGLTVTVSEMNYAGFDQIDERTVPASDFLYIYELD